MLAVSAFILYFKMLYAILYMSCVFQSINDKVYFSCNSKWPALYSEAEGLFKLA